MSALLDDILSFLGIKRGVPPCPNPPPPPELRPDMHPIVPVTRVADPPVSCLVLGIVKSMDTEGSAVWSEWYDHRHGGMSSGYEDYSTFRCHGQTLSFEASRSSWRVQPTVYTPTAASNGHVFNLRERQLLVAAIDRRAQRLQDERDRAQREQGLYFEELGCPDTPFVPPFKGTIDTITINDTENNRKLWALLHDADPVKRKAAEEAAEAVLGHAARVGWTGRDPAPIPIPSDL